MKISKDDLNLLKPDIKKVFLSFGKGQMVTYLNLDSNIGEEVLKKDIKAGATQFKPILELTKKKDSRFVVIETDNREQGLLGVTYLAGVYAEHEKLKMYDDGIPYGSDEVNEELGEHIDGYQKNNDEIFGSYGMTEEEEVEEFEEGDDYWQETSCWIPIIEFNDIKRYELTKENDGFLFANQNMLMNQKNNNQRPFWLDCCNESICIVCDTRLIQATDARCLQRFTSNRHVYIVLVESSYGMQENEDSIFTRHCETEKKSFVCEIMLEFTASIVQMKVNQLKLDRYYDNLFEGWLNEYGLVLENRFPKTRIIKRILSLCREDKAQLMEKVLLYIMKDRDEGSILTEKDFEVLDYFNVLSKEEKEGKKSKIRLEKELVGMEEVKQQVQDIINVMKYNKFRQGMGLKNSSFHNVHLLIGAPGTAKTTVAEIMGNMMREEGLLNGNRFISINGADLKGLYVGHSAPKTKAYFDNYDIIFIDEAYSIVAGDIGGMDSFSQEAVSQLIIELERHATDRLVVFAGYGGPNVSEQDNKMKEFLEANPGIKSRINSTIYFNSYTPEEMVQIVHRLAERMDYSVNKKVDEMIRDYFIERGNQKNFGNGREARSLLEQCIIFAARRVMSTPKKEISKKQMKEILFEDVENAIRKQKNENILQAGRIVNCGFMQ